MSTQIGTVKVTYTVAAGSGGTLQVTLLTDLYDNSNFHTLEGQTTYQVSSSGNATLKTIVSINYGGDSIDGSTLLDVTFNF